MGKQNAQKAASADLVAAAIMVMGALAAAAAIMTANAIRMLSSDTPDTGVLAISAATALLGWAGAAYGFKTIFRRKNARGA